MKMVLALHNPMRKQWSGIRKPADQGFEDAMEAFNRLIFFSW